MFFFIMVYYCTFITFNFNVSTYSVQAVVYNSSSSGDEPTFKTEIKVVCEKGLEKLVITGDVIRFSEILHPNGTFQGGCGNNTNLTVAYIFALRKVFIDQSLKAPGFDLFLLAPTWQLLTVAEISLNGLDGEPMTTPGTSLLGKDGEDGKPGNPGKPGGNFYGVGETYIDGEYLTVDVSGGNGGPGQKGGVGGPGTVGRHALKSNLSLTCTHSACDSSGTMDITALDDHYEYTTFKCKEEYNYIIYDMFFLPPVSANVRHCSYYIYGASGIVAGSGGDGGVGGQGGHPGQILLTEFCGKSGIVQVKNTGHNGTGGRGNQGGLWPYRGWDVSYKKRETYPNVYPRISGTVTVRYINSRTYVRSPKSLGEAGKNSRNLSEPVHGKPLNLSKLVNVLAEYKVFIDSHKKP